MPKILVVDDEPNNTEIATRVLKRENYEVVTATNRADAVAMALAERPDLIIMDMALPAPLDGQQATREIRSHAGMASVPIIGMSASTVPHEVEEMLRAGCDDFMAKPFVFAHFLDRIETLLTRGTRE
jgi:DNA-binding response OmpR family regulator